MRLALACLLVAALTDRAGADAKINGLVKFYEKETKPCLKNARGVTSVLDRGRPVASSDKEIADDLAELAKLQATVQAQCDEIASMIEFLRSDPSATFKQIQKDFEERDKRLRDGRIASKQALADAQPLISRLIPRINKLVAQAEMAAHPSTREQKEAAAKEEAAAKAAAEKAAAEKAAADKAAADKAAADKAAADKAAADKAAKAGATKPGTVPVARTSTGTPASTAPLAKAEPKPPAVPLAKFPSGRGIELPTPTEAWTLSGTADTDVADYAFAGAKATVSVRRAAAVSCEQVRTSAALLGGRAPAQLEVSAELKPVKPAWLISWSQDNHQVQALCVPSKQGAIVGRIEVTVTGNAPLDTALARMVAAQFKR